MVKVADTMLPPTYTVIYFIMGYLKFAELFSDYTDRSDHFLIRNSAQILKPIKSYVQVRRGTGKIALPKKRRKLKYAIHDSKIYTVLMEDGYRNRNFDQRFRKQRVHAHEQSKRTKRYGLNTKPKCVNVNEVIDQNMSQQNLGQMINCLRDRNFGIVPFNAEKNPFFRNNVTDFNIDQKLEMIDKYFNNLLKKYSPAQSKPRTKRSSGLKLNGHRTHGVLSEVYYKDEMNRNQQNDLFNDIRNHVSKTNKPNKHNNIVVRKKRIMKSYIEGLKPPRFSLTTSKLRRRRKTSAKKRFHRF